MKIPIANLLTKTKQPITNKIRKPETPPTPPFSMRMGESKRLTLTYVVIAIWISLAVFGIIVEADLYGLAVYFASGLPLIMSYLWSETKRPTIKDASQLVKNINSGRKNRHNDRGGYGDYGGGYDDYGGGYRRPNYEDEDYGNSNTNVNNNVQDTNIEISIFSDDSSVELKTDEAQLNTLMNTGYVDSNGDNYTFKKTELEQVKSLIGGDSEQEPDI